jgi:hypothetical protein
MAAAITDKLWSVEDIAALVTGSPATLASSSLRKPKSGQGG